MQTSKKRNKSVHSVRSDKSYIDAAKLFETRGEWKTGGGTDYQEVMRRRRHIIPECTTHMRYVGCYDRSYVVYVYVFRDKTAYVGLTCDPIRRNRTHTREKGPVFEKIKIGIKYRYITLAQTLFPNEAATFEPSQIVRFADRGYEMLNIHQGGSLGNIRSKYTLQLVVDLAKTCQSREDFSTLHLGAYQFCSRKGWIDKIADACGWPDNVLYKWTYETCKAEAKKYEFKKQWIEMDYNSYMAAVKHGWIKQIYAETGLKDTPAQSKYTYDICRDRAKDFTSRTDWQYKSGDGTYQAARDQGWLEGIFKEVGLPRVGRWGVCQEWTKERCLEIAKAFKRRSHWKLQDPTSFAAAKRNSWLPAILQETGI